MENTKDQWKIELLGVRGSMAVTPKEYQEFGSDTLCVQIMTPSQVIFLDAGTGIMYGEAGTDNHVLIGHPHLDHLLGLCKWRALADPEKSIKIYMKEHSGMNCEKVLHTLYGPPFWPVHLEEISKGLSYATISEELKIGDVKVEMLEGNHPGGVTHYKLSDGTRTLVYAVDCELTPETEEKLIAFAKDCDVLLCDGQLFDSEAENKKGWGHSTMSEAARLGMLCNAKQTILVHFDPSATDEQLRMEEMRIKEKYSNCVFGRQGDIRYL